MNWQADDSSWSLDLPWDFTFYGDTYDSVWVCSNGFLDFTSEDPSYSNSSAALKEAVRIAPLWDDLQTNAGDGEVYVTSTDTFVAIHWKGQTYSGARPVDFEAILYRDGTIRFNYGLLHNGLSPTIGISAGNGEDFLLASLKRRCFDSTKHDARFRLRIAPAPGTLVSTRKRQLSPGPDDCGRIHRADSCRRRFQPAAVVEYLLLASGECVSAPGGRRAGVRNGRGRAFTQ